MIRKNVYSSHIMRIQNILIFTAYFKYFSKFSLLQSLSMQAKQSFQCGNGINQFSSHLADPLELISEFASNCPILVKTQTDTSLKEEANAKRKGRPKGEKNNTERERKPKLILSEGNRKRGHWSLEENKRYHWFLEIYNKHFICKEMRRLDKIFKTMALFIGSRQAQQCRSHHQKMEKKYHSFLSIILYLRRFHYGSEDQRIVQQDMLNNEVKQSVEFINIDELQEKELNQKIPPTPSIIQQAKLDIGMDQPYRQIQFQQNIFDFLGQNYEHLLHIDDALF